MSELSEVMLVVAAFLSTLLFGYLFQWTATARAVRPMLERRQPPSRIELALLRKVPKLAAAQAKPSGFNSKQHVLPRNLLQHRSKAILWHSMTAAAEVFVFLSGIAAIWGVVFPFEVIGDDMLQKEFGYSADNAGFIIALAPMISICSPAFAPLLGSSLSHKLVAFGSSVATESIFCLQKLSTAVYVIQQSAIGLQLFRFSAAKRRHHRACSVTTQIEGTFSTRRL